MSIPLAYAIDGEWPRPRREQPDPSPITNTRCYLTYSATISTRLIDDYHSVTGRFGRFEKCPSRSELSQFTRTNPHCGTLITVSDRINISPGYPGGPSGDTPHIAEFPTHCVLTHCVTIFAMRQVRTARNPRNPT